MNVFKFRDAEIRLRGDDTSLSTYINRRYPVVSCADPYHQADYEMRIILTDPQEESNHILRHNKMMNGLLEQNDLVKTLYVNVSSWMKHFLYDSMIKFDMFSGYETQLLFLDYLYKRNLLKLTPLDDPFYNPSKPSTWLQITLTSTSDGSTDIEMDVKLLGSLFLDFLKYLVLELSMSETDF